LHRTVCDYVAGMTDRYLMEEYARITGDKDALPR
jgi:dGTP triphosphohydrolase